MSDYLRSHGLYSPWNSPGQINNLYLNLCLESPLGGTHTGTDSICVQKCWTPLPRGVGRPLQVAQRRDGEGLWGQWMGFQVRGLAWAYSWGGVGCNVVGVGWGGVGNGSLGVAGRKLGMRPWLFQQRGLNPQASKQTPGRPQSPSTQSRLLRAGIRNAIFWFAIGPVFLVLQFFLWNVHCPYSLEETILLWVVKYVLKLKCHFTKCHHHIFQRLAIYIALLFCTDKIALWGQKGRG